MEILNGYETEVKFPVPVNTDVEYTVRRQNETTPLATGTVTPVKGLAVVPVPYSAVTNDQFLRIEVEFDVLGESYTKGSNFEVVTPYLEMHELAEIHDQGTNKELLEVESAVRHIINAHTGQSFGFQKNVTYKVRGDGSTSLYLPRRSVNIYSAAGRTRGFRVVNEGWMLKMPFHYAPSVKADSDGYHMHTGGVIHNPNNVRQMSFKDGEEFEVAGDWGWTDVPNPIREAAKLLVNDYACADSQYRDRFLTSMTAADWRIQFHSGAFRETGNVRADQLLKEFVVRRGWAVV